ncbi:hypothetical protein BDZ89DRAFT_1130874 [Hymenopellis radicata]|nr:hypothetical protein BDZ89DRAFT_1130874 [Hymenopellis radicata]
MPTNIAWNTPEGKAAVHDIVVKRIPTWTNGLHERQEGPILLILDKKEVLLCTATGDGKSALFTVPILCHQEVSRHPQDYPNFSVRKLPVGLIITPTKGLAKNIVKSLAEHAYDRETISTAIIEKRNLVKEIASCTSFQVICIDPEHLHARAWCKILDDTDFRANLIYACLEEGHVAVEWGPTFREAYNNIGTFMRGRLPSSVPVFTISATLEPGAPTTALCKVLGFRAGNFTLFRFSNERNDLQFIIEPLEQGLSSHSFPHLLPYLNTGRKVVIYAPSLEIVTRIYLYLFSMEPPGVNHGERVRVRQYTALCEPEFNEETIRLAQTSPALQVVVSTVALANGIHIPALDDSLSHGMPTTLSQTEQQWGRAARAPGATGKAVVFVQKSDIKKAQKFLAGLGASAAAATAPARLTGRRKKKKKSAEEFMDPAKAEVLTETDCIISAKNRRWQNPDTRNCVDAGRALWCSLCCKRENRTMEFPARESVHPPFLAPAPKSKETPIPTVLKLKKKERPIAVEKISEFAMEVLEGEMYNPGNENWPDSSFFPLSLQKKLSEQVLRITTRDVLDKLLEGSNWRFQTTWTSKLFARILDIQYTINSARPATRPKANGSKKRTQAPQKRRPKRQPWDTDSDSSSSDKSDSDEDETEAEEAEEEEADEEQEEAEENIIETDSVPQASTSQAPVPAAPRRSKRVLEDVTNQPTRAVRPRQQNLLSVKDVMAGYGPVRVNNRSR